MEEFLLFWVTLKSSAEYQFVQGNIWVFVIQGNYFCDNSTHLAEYIADESLTEEFVLMLFIMPIQVT